MDQVVRALFMLFLVIAIVDDQIKTNAFSVLLQEIPPVSGVSTTASSSCTILLGSSSAFRFSRRTIDSYRNVHQQWKPLRSVSTSSSSDQENSIAKTNINNIDDEIQTCLLILYAAAETKQEDSEKVCEALSSLEKLVRQKAKEDSTFAITTCTNLTGDWRLIFTTGTANTQKRFGGARINYFPLKAIQSFNTAIHPMTIQNGIYVGDFPVLRFSGTMDFDLKKRQLQFDFNEVLLFNFFNITLQQGDAASFGAKSGLGSESNIKNVNKKKPFFNWIQADSEIATARGGGGGLALWKRV